jgi:hypothetical protein
MKKIFILVFIILLSASPAMAGTSDLFIYNKSKVDQELALLNDLEVFVSNNPGISLLQMQKENNSLLRELNITSGGYGESVMQLGQDPLGLPAYFWGCSLGLLGVLIVAAVSDDAGDTHQALRGCLYNFEFWSTVFLIWFYISYY